MASIERSTFTNAPVVDQILSWTVPRMIHGAHGLGCALLALRKPVASSLYAVLRLTIITKRYSRGQMPSWASIAIPKAIQYWNMLRTAN
jgi:hypothetical protein